LAQRLTFLRAKDLGAIASHLSSTVTRRAAKYVKRMTTGMADVFICELCRGRGATARAIIHQPSCLIAELRARIEALGAGHLRL